MSGGKSWTRVFGGVKDFAEMPKRPRWVRQHKLTPEDRLRGALKSATGPKNSRCDSLLRKFD